MSPSTQTISHPVRQRPPRQPQGFSSTAARPAGHELTDGIFWQHHGKTRILGIMEPIGCGKYRAHAKSGDTFKNLGEFESCDAARAAIVKVNPIYDPANHPVQKNVNRAKKAH